MSSRCVSISFPVWSAQNYKIKSKSYNQLTELFAHTGIFAKIVEVGAIPCQTVRKTVKGGVIPGQIVKDLARCRIIFYSKIVSQYMKLNICKAVCSAGSISPICP